MIRKFWLLHSHVKVRKSITDYPTSALVAELTT